MSHPIPDPFESSRRKLARADKHFGDLHRELQAFMYGNPYERVAEPHPEKAGHVLEKIRMTKPIPDSIADLTADIAVTLRSALDNAGYSLAVAGGVATPRYCAFPFAGSVDKMASGLGRAKDIPEIIYPLFCGFQPYKGGNDLLWALNEVANTDKHKMMIPVGQALRPYGTNIHGTGFFSMPQPHVWDRTKNEMVLVELGPGATFHYDFQFTFHIAFHDIDIIDGQPVLGILHQFGSVVQRVLMAIEAESRRLGIIK
jgi:hypothetical protein